MNERFFSSLPPQASKSERSLHYPGSSSLPDRNHRTTLVAQTRVKQGTCREGLSRAALGLLQDCSWSHMGEQEEGWIRLRTHFSFETAMLELSHPWDMPGTEKQQSLFYAVRGGELLGTILLQRPADSRGFQPRPEPALLFGEQPPPHRTPASPDDSELAGRH